jgi:hypothetical protein
LKNPAAPLNKISTALRQAAGLTLDGAVLKRYLENNSVFIVKVKFRIKFPGAFRTDAVAEFGSGMFMNICLDLIPIAFIVPDFLTVGTDGKQPAQCLHLGHRCGYGLIFLDQLSVGFR